MQILQRIKKQDGCWIWQGAKTSSGYGVIRINGQQHYAHRLVNRIFNETSTQKKPFVCHKCHEPSCVNPEHLYLGSHEDNMEDAKDNGEIGKSRLIGEDHGTSKLTKNNVLEIRNKYETGDYTHQQLADEYNIGRSQIGKILRGENWQHVGGPTT
jgi:hypothetical protein